MTTDRTIALLRELRAQKVVEHAMEPSYRALTESYIVALEHAITILGVWEMHEIAERRD